MTLLSNPFVMTHYTWKKISLASLAINIFLEICIFQIKWIYSENPTLSYFLGHLKYVPYPFSTWTSSGQQFLTRKFGPSRHLFVWRHFWLPQQGWHLLLASWGWRPRTLLKILQCTGQPHHCHRMICPQRQQCWGPETLL